MTRQRAAAFIIQGDQIALIERHRQDRHYYVFPGGGIEPDESPQDAVVREIHEELGLLVQVRQLAVEVWYNHTPHFYFLADVIGGEFGSGAGEEYTTPFNPWEGTYHPVWLPIADLFTHPVLPSPVAGWVMACHQVNTWPEQVHCIINPLAD